MKARYFLLLPLAASLMIPAVAQQDSQNSSNSNPAATTQDQTQSNQNSQTTQAPAATNEDQNLSAHQPLQPPPHEGFWGKLNPFARKKYVQRQMSPIRDRVNELDELTASNSKQIKDVDARATEGIRQASDRANQADQHAVEANNKAQQANDTATQANQRLGKVEQVVGSLDQYQPLTEAEINFRPGQQVLNQKAKEALDQIADQYTKSSQGSIIEVQGFSAGHGQAALHNSQAMSQAVARYLVVEHNIPVYRIYTVGMGNTVVAAKDGSTPERIHGGRVNVSLLHNNVGDLTQSASSSQPAPADQQQQPR